MQGGGVEGKKGIELNRGKDVEREGTEGSIFFGGGCCRCRKEGRKKDWDVRGVVKERLLLLQGRKEINLK